MPLSIQHNIIINFINPHMSEQVYKTNSKLILPTRYSYTLSDTQFNFFHFTPGQSNDLAEVLSVSFDPNPPEKGASFKTTTKTQLCKSS